MSQFSRLNFGDEFKWGVSTSAFQTEGTHDKDGKGPSIWDDFSKKKGAIKHNEHARKATKFLTNYQEDLDMVKWMEIENFRFSIAWSRIFPEGIGKVNQKGIDFYNQLIDYCLLLGIKPWVTLYHWDLPLRLEEKGGWRNREVIYWFLEYVDFCIKTFGDRVENWMVLNEPTAFTGLGYFMGIHAPGKKGLKNFLPAMHHAALANAEGGRMIKSLNHKLNVGTTLSLSPIEPFKQKESNYLAANRVDALLNKLYLEPLLGLGYPLEILPAFSKVEKYMNTNDEEKLKFNFDFIGVQNYSREVVSFSWLTPIVKAKLISAKKRGVERTAMGWEYSPNAIYTILKKLNEYENIPPIIITETGLSLEDQLNDEYKVKDQRRIEFLENSIQSVLKAKREGVKVDGYFVWSLTDNFEWAEGYRPRFGLLHVDYKTQKRVPKDSAFWYKKFLTT